MAAIVRVAVGALWTLWGFVFFHAGLVVARHWRDHWRSNCFIWTLKQCDAQGGKMVMVFSQYGPWLHAYWLAPEGVALEYVPHERKRKRRFPPLLFTGYVREVQTT